MMLSVGLHFQDLIAVLMPSRSCRWGGVSVITEKEHKETRSDWRSTTHEPNLGNTTGDRVIGYLSLWLQTQMHAAEMFRFRLKNLAKNIPEPDPTPQEACLSRPAVCVRRGTSEETNTRRRPAYICSA